MFHSVGILGILNPSLRESVLNLTPMNLLLTAFLFFWGNGVFSTKLSKAAFSAFSIGFIIEVIGVKTGVLFGEYYYGDPLGFKLFDVPLMMGVNWLILSFSSIGIVFKVVKSKILQVVFASLLMVFLDFLIEPVAMKLGFWTWASNEIPLQNYLMWFISGLLVNSIVIFYLPKMHFRTSLFVFSTQVYFFALLNLIE